MIVERSGNLLRDDAQALVNPVNTVGVMGKGLALQFKRAFPEIFHAYAAACRAGEVSPGRMHLAELPDGRWVVNFPTKRHWRERSRMEDIEAGLDDLARVIEERGIRSIAVPPLGCGNGGLPWAAVRRLVRNKLGTQDCEVRLYVPGTPAAEDMPTATAAPELTPARARLLTAVVRYIRAALDSGLTEQPRVSLLEIHKIAYLLQAVGLPLGIAFERGHYGPYAPDLDRQLSRMEGHQVLGYGDGTGGARADLRVLPEAETEAERRMAGDSAFEVAWERFARVVEGFAYPEGMELLASVHYLAVAGPTSQGSVAAQLANWNDRKRRLFSAEDVGDAFRRMAAVGLV